VTSWGFVGRAPKQQGASRFTDANIGRLANMLCGHLAVDHCIEVELGDDDVPLQQALRDCSHLDELIAIDHAEARKAANALAIAVASGKLLRA
jgi:hypothetical protein